LLGRWALVVPAHLAALLQVHGALGLDVLAEALVVGDLGELRAQVVDLPVRRLDPRHHLVQLLGRGHRRGAEQREGGEAERAAGPPWPLLARYSAPTRISRGLAPWPGPMMRSCSIMSMKRAAFG